VRYVTWNLTAQKSGSVTSLRCISDKDGGGSHQKGCGEQELIGGKFFCITTRLRGSFSAK